MNKLTQFQKRIISDLEHARNNQATTLEVAWNEFATEWNKKASRGAIISNIVRASYKLQKLKLVWVLPPKDRYSHHTICLRQENWAQYNNPLHPTPKAGAGEL